MFQNFYEFHIFDKVKNIFISTSKDPALAWWILDGMSEREDCAILTPFSLDVTDFCESASKQELNI